MFSFWRHHKSQNQFKFIRPRKKLDGYSCNFHNEYKEISDVDREGKDILHDILFGLQDLN